MSETAPTVRAAELAKVAGVTRQYAHQLLTGWRSPSLEKAIEIRDRLGIPVEAWPMPKVEKKAKA
jgi:transcriptional regulator with XRE-family HTH domain